MRLAAVLFLSLFTANVVSAEPRIVFRDNFDTNSLVNKDIYEIYDTVAQGSDSPLSVEYETQFVSVGFDAFSSRYAILSCTIPPFPANADTYRIQIDFLNHQIPGISNLWFGYGLRGSGYILNDKLAGYLIRFADGTGGQRIHWYRLEAGEEMKQIGLHHCKKFSPLDAQRILMEIGIEGIHRITCHYDTGSPFAITMAVTDTAAYSSLNQEHTRLQLRGTSSGNSVNRPGQFNTDTWLAEAEHVRLTKKKHKIGRRR